MYMVYFLRILSSTRVHAIFGKHRAEMQRVKVVGEKLGWEKKVNHKMRGWGLCGERSLIVYLSFISSSFLLSEKGIMRINRGQSVNARLKGSSFDQHLKKTLNGCWQMLKTKNGLCEIRSDGFNIRSTLFSKSIVNNWKQAPSLRVCLLQIKVEGSLQMALNRFQHFREQRESWSVAEWKIKPLWICFDAAPSTFSTLLALLKDPFNVFNRFQRLNRQNVERMLKRQLKPTKWAFNNFDDVASWFSLTSSTYIQRQTA